MLKKSSSRPELIRTSKVAQMLAPYTCCFGKEAMTDFGYFARKSRSSPSSEKLMPCMALGDLFVSVPGTQIGGYLGFLCKEVQLTCWVDTLYLRTWTLWVYHECRSSTHKRGPTQASDHPSPRIFFTRELSFYCDEGGPFGLCFEGV